MRVYRWLWVTATAVIVSVAALVDATAYGLARLAVWGLAVGVFGGLVAFALAEGRTDRWAWTRRGAAWAGFGAAAADALVMTWGSAGALTGSAILVTSPAVLGLVRGNPAKWSEHRASGPPGTLEVRDLLRRWERTSEEMVRADTPVSRRLALVEERSQLLEEIERRDPSHFGAWVASAALDRRTDHQ